MFFTPFTKWLWTRLSDICQENLEYITGEMRYINFMNWCGPSHIYASFRINRTDLSSGKNIRSILVAHEGDWTNDEGMSFCLQTL